MTFTKFIDLESSNILQGYYRKYSVFEVSLKFTNCKRNCLLDFTLAKIQNFQNQIFEFQKRHKIETKESKNQRKIIPAVKKWQFRIIFHMQYRS